MFAVLLGVGALAGLVLSKLTWSVMATRDRDRLVRQKVDLIR